MPRTSPISRSEAQVCARFREARIRANLKQADLAREIGIQPDRLAGYEHARNPVPYWIGDRLALQTNACQRWLATGLEPATPHIKVDEAVLLAVPKGALFSQVYVALLDAEFVGRIEDYEAMFKDLPAAGRSRARSYSPAPGDKPIHAPPIEHLRGSITTLTLAFRVESELLDEAELKALYRELETVAHKYERIAGKSVGAGAVAQQQRASMVRNLKAKWEAYHALAQKKR